MTLPSSGTISLNDFNIEMGRGSGVFIDMSFIYDNTKLGQQAYNLANYYSKAWIQRNNEGNCDNGNCTNNCNCACDFQCTNCLINGGTNCLNCDGRPYIQNNCNCATGGYNCSVCTEVTYNCNCEPPPVDCGVCPCCFPADSLVTMADGSQKRIDQILVGDVVDGGFGYKNTVQMFHETPVGKWPIYVINGRHRTTGEHKHWTTIGWACIDVATGKKPTKIFMTVDNNGKKEWRENTKFTRTQTHELKVGMTLITTQGLEVIESIVLDKSYGPDSIVYTLCTDGSHSHVISNNIIVGAWSRDIDFDYDTWTPLAHETQHVKNNNNLIDFCIYADITSTTEREIQPA